MIDFTLNIIYFQIYKSTSHGKITIKNKEKSEKRMENKNRKPRNKK